VNKVVCFDFDGVIISSSKVQRHAFNESYHEIMGKNADDVLIEEFFNNSGDSLSNIFTKMKLPFEMIGSYRRISIERSDKIQLHKGMKELLAYLNEKGIKCGLCTGKDRERTLMILENMGLSDYFSAVVCSDDVSHPKPNPESLFVLMEKLDADKNFVVMVGDANNDIKCAKSAGIPSIGVTWGDVKREMLLQDFPDYVTDKVSDLKTSIENILEISLKSKYLFNDFVVAEDKCNMQCEYCLTQTSQFKKEHDESNLGVKKLSDLTYKEGTEFQKKMDAIQENLLEGIDVAILKISGGEILILPQILDYILKQAKVYKGVQVLTNGVLLNEQILRKFKEAENICLQISLDHHTMEGNSYRTKKEVVLKRVLDNIDLAYEIGVPVEINCVLTDKNTGILSSFLEYLLKYEEGVIVYPFPVRGSERNSYYMKDEQIVEIQNIIENYHKYEKVLAPRVYMEYILDFLKTGKRKINCYLPYMAVGVFEDGTVTPCPNYWFTSLGSLLEDKQKVVNKIGKNYIYEVLTCNKNPFKQCKTCFTPWETFNLYVEGIMSYEELTKSPSYRFPGVKEYIKSIENTICNRNELHKNIIL